MGTRKVNFNKKGISQLPNNKAVLYKIKTEGGTLNYAGVAQRSRVRDRISEHLGEIPGATVQIEQFGSIEDTKKKGRPTSSRGASQNTTNRASKGFQTVNQRTRYIASVASSVGT
ncbi:MAG: hypothetical protein V2A69_13480 [Pseudomonadota bacterium]